MKLIQKSSGLLVTDKFKILYLTFMHENGPLIVQCRTSRLPSLLRTLDETSDPRKFRYRIDFDWFKRTIKMAGIKIPRSSGSLDMHLKARHGCAY